MNIEDKVLIPLAVLLVILIILVVLISCRFYLWNIICKKKQRYHKLSQGSITLKGYPKMPPLTTNKQSVQMLQEDQYSIFSELDKREQRRRVFENNNNKFHMERLQLDYESDSRSSGISEGSTANSDTQPMSPSYKNTSPTYQSNPHIYLSQQRASSLSAPKPGRLTRFMSEPTLLEGEHRTMTPVDVKRLRFSNVYKKRLSTSALPLVSPTGGQIEFGLYYNVEQKSLDVTIKKLFDINLKPENFLGILKVLEKHEHYQTNNKIYLTRNKNGSFELSDSANIGFFIYITLLPKRKFKWHTNLVFGTGTISYNEKFSITGYSTEQLSTFYLCFHVLCKFNYDGEPLVLGEAKIPLKRIHLSQVLPFMANLGPAEEEIELEINLKACTDLGDLHVVLFFNPMAHNLSVKIVQATGLPKIGMTGQPNASVKTHLYFCNGRVAKRSTKIQKRQTDPVFNETHNFDISKDRITECDLLFEIRHHGPMYRTVIGYVNIGSSAEGEGSKHWSQLLDFSSGEKKHKIVIKKPVGFNL